MARLATAFVRGLKSRRTRLRARLSTGVGLGKLKGTQMPIEAVLFVGAPGSGKTSFFKERFFSTHVRISLDLLKTRSLPTKDAYGRFINTIIDGDPETKAMSATSIAQRRPAPLSS